MDRGKGWLWATGMAAGLVGAAPAGAAVLTASFRVSVTVVGSCRIVPGQARGCAPAATPGAAIPVPEPVVHYSRDAKTGTTIETVEF